MRPASNPTATSTLASTTRGTALTVAGLISLLLLDGAILNTSLPRMAEALGTPTLMLSAAITAYLLASAATIPLSPWLAQRFGGRRVCLLAVAVFTLASVGCGVSASLSQLVVARVLQGAAGGLMLAVGRILALGRASKAELMSVTALLVWPALLAPVIGPPLGGFITTYISWRWNFLMNLPLGLIGLVLIVRFIPRDVAADRRRTPFDWLGALLTALGLGTLLAGLESVAHAVDTSQRVGALALVGAGLLLLAWDMRHLRRSPHPLLSVAALRVPTFAACTLSGGTVSMLCIQATPYLLPLMFQLAFGMSAVAAGALLLPYFLGNLMMKTVTTPVLRRFGFRRVLLVDGVIEMLAVGACGLLGPAMPEALLIGLLVLAGAARSMLFTALNTLMLADIDLPERGAAATLSAVAFQLATVLGVALATGLLVLFGAPQQPPVLHDFQLAFFALGAVGLLSLVRYLRLAPDAGAEVSGHPLPAVPAAGVR